MSEEFFEILSGIELNKSVEDKHLGKSLQDVLENDFSKLEYNEKSLDFLLDLKNEKNDNSIKKHISSIISNEKSTNMQIIKLSNIIMKLALKYTQDIFSKRKNKEILNIIRELIADVKDVKEILMEVHTKIIQSNLEGS